MEISAKTLALLNTGSPNAGSGFLDALKGPLLIVVLAFGLALIIAIVILITHRDGGTQKSSHARAKRLLKANSKAPGEEGDNGKKRRRHKRRRRSHRKRNPTLSETGGLPSKKEENLEENEAESDQ